MTLQTRSTWLVSSKRAKYDLDNILLKDIPSYDNGVEAEFQLEHLLVEGSCEDRSNGDQPPRGLELVLGDSTDAHQHDSLVMTNLGYFQLKARPGVWDLRISEGRHRDVYQLLSSGAEEGIESLPIFVDAFDKPSVPVAVRKRSGMEREPLFLPAKPLQDNQDSGWASITRCRLSISLHVELTPLRSLFGSKKEAVKTVSEDDKIHVFSLASGHL